MSETPAPLSQPIVAGVSAGLVGYIGSFAIVLAGLYAVGATAAQAGSGLLVVSLIMAAACFFLALRYRMPIAIAWSTPGVALLAASGGVEGGWPAALGAFLVVGALTVLTGLWRGFGHLIMLIPGALAQAMLAGVLLPLCLAPITGIAENPWGVVPVLLTWLLAMRLAPRWAVPIAFAAAAIVVTVHLVTTQTQLDAASLLPQLDIVAPTFTVGAIVGLALPVFIVTMAAQNVPGVAIMRSYGYDIPWRGTMFTTGLGSIMGASAGSPGINLAAVSAALAAAPEADPDPRRRWVTTVSAGCAYVVLGAGASALATLAALAPAAVIPAVAGVALFTTLGSAMQQASSVPEERIPAVVTFLIAASGVAFFGISAAFWALLIGLLARGVLRFRRGA